MTLVSSISVHAIESCACLCVEGTTKANNPSVSPLGVMFTYSIPFFMVKLFLMQNSAFPSSESECSPMYVLSKASLFWRGTSFVELIHLQQAANSTSSPCASSQLVNMHGCQLEGTGLRFFTQVIMFHWQGSANEDFSPLCCASHCSFQERLYSILVMSDRYSAQRISGGIVWSFLIFQCKFIGFKCSDPMMSCHI